MDIQAKRWLRGGAVVAAAAALGVSVAATPVSAQDTSQVYVVHGIPDQPVDVYVNQELTLEAFQPGDVAGPLDLPAGSYDVALTEPGEDVAAPLVSAEELQVPPGQNLSLAAHLTEEGEPTVTAFVNDVMEVPAGEARLTVRHTAAAPAVDVRADNTTLFSGVTNPMEATGEVAGGTYNVDVVLADTEDVVLGPTDLTLTEGTLAIVYAIGSADEDTLELVVQVIEDLNGAPTAVPTGTGGLATTGPASWSYALAGAGALLLIGGALRYATVRPAEVR